jgi:hypothetical protein
MSSRSSDLFEYGKPTPRKKEICRYIEKVEFIYHKRETTGGMMKHGNVGSDEAQAFLAMTRPINYHCSILRAVSLCNMKLWRYTEGVVL